MSSALYLSRYLLITAFVAIYGNAFGQDGFASKFQEASRLDEEKEDEQALSIWIELATKNPENGNVNYRAGLSYLNSHRQKTAALPFFQVALEAGINKRYDPISHLEKQVPIEIWYYMGKAYHLAYQLEKAEEAYGEFLKSASGKHRLHSLAELGIHQVSNAKMLMANPVQFEIENLGPVVNSQYADFSPVISVDENALFFTSTRLRPDSSNIRLKDIKTGEYFEDVYATYKNRKGEWQQPELLEINTTNHTATVNVTVDGQILYIYQDDKGVGNLYESKLIGETWSAPIKLKGDVNSPHWEPHIAVSADGQTAFFVSNRPGGLGGRDIYQTKLLPNGEWGKAQNLGPGINTPYEEDAVFISPDGLTLYFSSEGHSSMGGFDIFASTLQGHGAWGPPENVGYPINTVDDDVFLVTSADGIRAYYSSFRESGFGQKDIYMINLPQPREVRLALLKGTIIPAGGQKLPQKMSVLITPKDEGATEIFTPRQRDGTFVAILQPCEAYDVAYQIDGEVLATDTFSLACNTAYQEIYKELLLSPVLVNEDGSLQVIHDATGYGVALYTTVSTTVPAVYKRHFGYNQNKEVEEEMIVKFMLGVKALIDTKGQAQVSVVGSASKVPTRSYNTNENLANVRAQNGRDDVMRRAKAMGIDVSKIVFTEVKGKVQGPDYKGDFKNEGRYRPFQYIEITAN